MPRLAYSRAGTKTTVQELLTGSNDCQIMVWSPQGDDVQDAHDTWSDGFESPEVSD